MLQKSHNFEKCQKSKVHHMVIIIKKYNNYQKVEKIIHVHIIY